MNHNVTAQTVDNRVEVLREGQRLGFAVKRPTGSRRRWWVSVDSPTRWQTPGSVYADAALVTSPEAAALFICGMHAHWDHRDAQSEKA